MEVNQKESSSKTDEYFENATLHGISKIYSAKKCYTKIFWIIIFILFLISFAVLLHSHINKYFSFGIDVSTIYEENAGAMPFPAVTVCNVNRVSLKKFTKLLSLPEDGVFDFNYCAAVKSMVSNMSPENFDDISNAEHFFIPETSLFNGIILKNIPENFRLTTKAIDGSCFTFNYNGAKSQTKPDPRFALKLFLNIEVDDYFPCDYIYSQKSAGVNVFIHKQNSAFDINRAINVGPGQASRIIITKSSIERLKHPYSDNCRGENDSSNDEFPIITGTMYTVPKCHEACYIMKLNKTCGGIDFESSLGLLDAYLNSFKVLDEGNKCLNRFTHRYLNGSIHCKCNPICHEIIYHPTVNSVAWPPKVSVNEWIKRVSTAKNVSVDETYIRNNLVALEIFFQEFRVLKTVHTPAYLFNNLAADMGGLFGLFLGASVFSLVELLVFLCTALGIKFLYSGKDRRASKIEAELKNSSI